ncbi:MAG: DUF4129 domain-containing protein [Actinobacteria bacterium]|nr:DUF4129 domain-containing protein [Actinomycetota bacterium]
MAVSGVVAPDRRELRACGLAALAEAGVLALPMWMLLTETRGIGISVLAFTVPFVAVYVGGAVLVCTFRASRGVAIGAVVLAVIVGAWLGRGDANRAVFAVVVCLLIAFRLATLALRDWRQPIHAELGWFALALGLEVIVASDATPEWRGSLLVIVPLFFVAGLASRASTVWTSGGAGQLDDRVRAVWIRRAVLATGALIGAMLLAVGLSVRGGVIDRIGEWLTPAANAVASFLVWGLSQAARPVFWLVDLFGIDPDGVREFFESLREDAARRAAEQDATPGAPAAWQRLLALCIFAAIGFAVYRAIRRLRAPTGETEPHLGVPGGTGESAPPQPVVPARPRFRREPPADAVRRMYAASLDALHDRDFAKDPWQTPAEFAPAVCEAFPECATEFTELTRAYEDVRYGSLRLDGSAIRRLEAGHQRTMRVFGGS